MAILTLNAGSATLKFALYAASDSSPRLLCRGLLDYGHEAVTCTITDANGAPMPAPALPGDPHDPQAVIETVMDWMEAQFPGQSFAAISHRVVHGGPHYRAPVQVDDAILAELERLIPLAPLHQPAPLAMMRHFAATHPEIPQIACFDTAFHRTQPEVFQHFALPRHFADEGVLRYGFHGLSYAYIASVLPQIAPDHADGRVIVSHLGSGASLCAMRGRQSIASSMGFTALEGLMMGTRCGRLDPGVVLYLIQQRGMNTAEVEQLLYRESGLLGVSGISADVRTLEASDKPEASEALSLFAHRAAQEIGSLAAAIQGLDALVFTAGIGEHSARIRANICNLSDWLGIRFDPQANDAQATLISTADSPVAVYVIPTDEQQMLARYATDMLSH